MLRCFFFISDRTPPRDVEAELKEELDAFVLAVLTEYSKLFLEPGADVRHVGYEAPDSPMHLSTPTKRSPPPFPRLQPRKITDGDTPYYCSSDTPQ